jgi:hypothetical protein
MSVPEEVVQRFIGVGKELDIYKPDVWRPVVHGPQCAYDPMPPGMNPLDELPRFVVQG